MFIMIGWHLLAAAPASSGEFSLVLLITFQTRNADTATEYRFRLGDSSYSDRLVHWPTLDLLVYSRRSVCKGLFLSHNADVYIMLLYARQRL